jgi:hypothetical protein
MVSDDCARRGSTVRAWDLREQGRKPCRQLAFPFTHCTGRLSGLSRLFGWSGLFGLAGWFGQSGEDRLNRQDRLAAYPFAWNPIRWGLDSGALKSWRIVSKSIVDRLVMSLEFALQLRQLLCQATVRCQQFTKPHKGTNDLRAHLDGTCTVEHHRGHNGSMLGESIRQGSPPSPSCL